MDNLTAKKSVALLIDPDKSDNNLLVNLLSLASECKTDYIMIGGSLTSSGTNDLIKKIKSESSVPVILFPGNLLQLSTEADIIFLLSLISGRNSELLIGNHVLAAPFLKNVKNKVVSVGYILVSCGSKTSVEYMSQTEAIPSEKTDIAVATALAGEMLGLKMIYLEAGSGANYPVPLKMIKGVRENTTIPLIVGGGIRDEKTAEEIFSAGADMIVLGNGCELNPLLLKKVCSIRDSFIR